MRANRIVQTGPKRKLGGLKNGFSKEAYQVGIEGIVKIVPADPMAIETMTKRLASKKSLVFIAFGD